MPRVIVQFKTGLAKDTRAAVDRLSYVFDHRQIGFDQADRWKTERHLNIDC